MSHLDKKLLGAGAVMVALSSFVPNPFMAGDAWAQASASDTMDITAKVVNPLNVKQLNALDFGEFAVKSTGTYNFKAGGTATLTAGAGVIVTPGTVGQVQLEAPQSAAFTLSIPELSTGTAIQLLTAGTTMGTVPSKTLKVTQIYLKGSAKFATSASKTFTGPGGQTATGFQITDTGEVGTMTVGGSLTFGITQVEGVDYSGSYTLIQTF